MLIQVVSQLKPRRCGVSDQAISLAQELETAFAIDSAFVVLNSTEPCDLGFTKVYCAPSQLLETCLSLSGGEPGTLLVHLSGYGFSADGAPTLLADALAKVRESGRFRVAVYFHELFASGMPWRSAFWYSGRQRNAVRRIAEDCDLLVTNMDYHAKWLEREPVKRSAIPIQRLPVFSSVGETSELTPMTMRKPAMAVFGLAGTRRRAYASLSSLGSFLDDLGIKEIVDIGPDFDAPTQLRGIPVKRMGVLAAANLAGLLSQCKFGFVPHSSICLAKSSIFAGYCAHGTIPVIANSFREEVDGLRDGVHLVSPRTAVAAQAAGLDQCSASAWHWYSGHRLHAHAAFYAGWLAQAPSEAERIPTGLTAALRHKPGVRFIGGKMLEMTSRTDEPAPGIHSKSMSNLAVLLAHPTGNQNVRNALRSLVENDMLAEFWTAIAWNPESPWNRLLPSSMRGQLGRRAFPEAPRKSVKSTPWREIVRLGARSSPLKNFLSSGERPFSVIGMYRQFDGMVARRLSHIDVDTVYAYEGGALQTFREAKRLGITTVHEQPSSHWYWVRKLLSEEAERNPEFAGLLPTLRDSSGHMEWKDEELVLADYVFVPSLHVRRTLAGVVPEEKIRVINYGAPPVRPRTQVSIDSSRPLKVLFVGALGQHKGIGYLLEAVEQLGSRVELTLVGRRLRANRRVDEACNRWRWFETLPHSVVLERMCESDVLVLPSLTEGCALVVLEALSCGLPVVVTPNTGSLEFVRNECEGFIVPICRADAIAERLNTLDRDRELLAQMSRNAQTTAAEKSWNSYRTNWANALRAVS
jgi:glycosyltransferase involved in cell wall biosynthesis